MQAKDAQRTSVERRGLIQAALSLQCKATVLVVVVALAVTAAVSGYLMRSGFRLTRDQHDRQAIQLAAMLAKAAAPACEAGDAEALAALADEVANGSPFLYVIFSDVDGRELTSAEHQPGALPRARREADTGEMVHGAPVRQPGPDGRPVCLDIIYPITMDRTVGTSASSNEVKLVGYVRAGMVADEWHRSMSTELDLVVGLGSLAVAAAVPLGFLVIRRIVSPLEGLADTMLRFSQGKLDVRSPVRRNDEIGRLVSAFNRMADQHQQTHERIVRLNADLELRVAERTQQLRELAAREPLTGLYNRRRFAEMLERSFLEALRYDNNMSCIMLDLDRFKDVNDKWGHQIGDKLLILTARTITSQLRSSDVPARFGGDEFIILLPQTDLDRARVLAQRIVDAFNENCARAFPQIRTSMSLGIASLRCQQVTDAESLIRVADRAMYRAKAAGQNLVMASAGAPDRASA